MQDSKLRPLPLGRSSFHTLRLGNRIYVDKTEQIYKICQLDDKIFLSRPRRFGKSLLVSTFESLFKYGLSDFKGLAIEKLWDDTTYDVVRLDFSQVKDFTSLQEFHTRFCDHIKSKFEPLGFMPDTSDPNVIQQLSSWLEQKEAYSLVCLVDEYDSPLTACLQDNKLFESVQKIISQLFSAFKSNDACLRFFFMTGITKYSNTGIFSEFNIFTDISLDPEYGTILGLTEEEISEYFSGHVANAANALGISAEALLENLRDYYDGFSFDEQTATHVYCPWSVLSFLKQPKRGFKNYWYASAGQPSALTNYLSTHRLDDPRYYMKMPRMPLSIIDSAIDYKKIQPELLLMQTGYLTFKNIDDAKIVTLGYPNREVTISMAQLYASQLLRDNTINEDDTQPTVKQILSFESSEAVFHMFNRVVNTVIYTSKAWCDEEACRSSMHVLLLGAALLPRVESPTGKGRSDLDVEIADRYWVFEFKYAKTRKEVDAKLCEAVEQIQSRRYGETMHGKTLIRMALVFCGEDRQFAAFQEV